MRWGLWDSTVRNRYVILRSGANEGTDHREVIPCGNLFRHQQTDIAYVVPVLNCGALAKEIPRLRFRLLGMTWCVKNGATRDGVVCKKHVTLSDGRP